MGYIKAGEWQFDGLIGPTHNYAGLAFGNIASANNAGQISNPRAAALQGLAKMRFVRDLGMPQAVLPPRKRPIIPVLQQLGFGLGSSPEAVAQTIDLAYNRAPHLLAACFSSSFMWAANAATVSPSSDTADGKLHLTPANLSSHFHRAIEAEETTRLLRIIFHNESLFNVHNALPSATLLADEGAANHMRVCSSHDREGVEIFVYGAGGVQSNHLLRYPARQQWEASQAIARLQMLDPAHTILLQQHPQAIDAGVFHNDVIAMNTTRLMIAHEMAFLNKDKFILDMERIAPSSFQFMEVSSKELSLADAVGSYLFNSQLLDLPSGEMVIVAPIECQEVAAAHNVLLRVVEQDGVVDKVHYLDVRESMRNGGGPACLRLRVVLDAVQAEAIHPGVVLSDHKFDLLHAWITRHYRDHLIPEAFRDPQFIRELDTAYAELETIMEMPGLYAAAV